MRGSVKILTLCKSRAGYTLIELAAVLIVVGVLLGSALGAYNVYLKQTSIRDTNLNIKIVGSALTDFLGRNGRYPCPAPLTFDRNNPGYGREDCTTALTPGACANGICGQTAPRAPNPAVRVGAVPFRALNLREEDALDGYYDRLVYAVTEPQTSTATYTVRGGAIEIVDGATPPKSILGAFGADFVVLSHGPDGAGATRANGSQSQPCPAGMTQTINCDFNANATYRYNAVSTSGTATQFDDSLTYFARGEQTPWSLTANANDDMFNKNMIPGKIGIMIDPVPNDTDIKAQVIGNVRARTNLVTQDLCQTDDSSTCTKAGAIGGALGSGGDDVQCLNPGEFMYGIADDQAECGPWKTQCASGMMTGIDADGYAICELMSCPITPITICSQNFTLPQGDLKDKMTLGPAGIDRRKTFVCKQGVWTATKTTGACTCTPTVVTDKVPCGPGYSGTRTIKKTWTCPANTWTGEVELSNTCKCVGGNETRQIACPSGQSGNINQKRTFSCKTQTWSSWTETGRNCKSCSNQTRTRTINCPGGDSGTILQESTKDCGTGQWGPWSELSNTCTCTGSQTETRTKNCPVGQTGSIREERTKPCGGAWSTWSEVSNSCTPGSSNCRWKSNGGGQTSNNPLGAAVRSTCGCGAVGSCYKVLGSGFYMNYPGSCSCE